MRVRTVPTVAAGILVGTVLALVLGGVLVGVEYVAMRTTANGWSTLPQCGKVGINILEQAVCADPQLGLPAANVAEEGMYWKTTVDGAGQKLSGQHDYTLHFPRGGLPPNSAFWSLTMYKVLLIGRVLVKSESDLTTGYDLSTQIRLTPLSTTSP